MSSSREIQAWSGPDARGIHARFDKRRTKRQRRSEERDALSITKWPAEWKQLAGAWLRSAGPSVRQASLFKAAGNARHLAYDVLDSLLESGWIELEDRFSRGAWTPYRVTWTAADDLRETLGLPRQDTTEAARLNALATRPYDPRLLSLQESLQGKPTKVVLLRAPLLASLDAWLRAGEVGTRHHFAHFARGHTKSVTQSEWNWLSAHLDLEEAGIGRHTPAIYLRGPIVLVMEAGRIDLKPVPDLIGLSPATVSAIKAIEGPACRWLLVENRTSFEDIARRAGGDNVVVWLPGFAPTWWLDAMKHLVSLFPGEGRIAADPDPAGIDIALRAGALWQGNWAAWGMSKDALDSLKRTKSLNDYDRQRLIVQMSATDLPPELLALASAMAEGDKKGEQEALDLMEWL